MNDPARPTRAILNFAHRCALNCEWCYVPFGQVPARKEIVESVVFRIAELGFTSITFGGGDPFQYSFISEVLRTAKSCGLFVHVDTHARGLRESATNLELIQNTIDLLGLPIDGSTPEVHDAMRNSQGHFDLVAKRLAWLRSARVQVKVNTIVSAINVSDMNRLANLIKFHAPKRWSVYQYWPLGPGASAKGTHWLSEADFLYAVEPLRDALAGHLTILEINERESRRDTYPIIHHDGTVFVHSRRPEDTFVNLGSIFEPETIVKIGRQCMEERPSAATRYFSITKADK